MRVLEALSYLTGISIVVLLETLIMAHLLQKSHAINEIIKSVNFELLS